MRLRANLHLGAIVAGELLFRGIQALRATAAFEAYGRDEVLRSKSAGQPIVFVGWHGDDIANLAMYHLFFPGSRGALLVPDDGNGRRMAWLAKRLGLRTTRLGSHHAPATTARGIVTMINLVRGGYDGMLAVDGPAGPARQVKPGAGLIAQRAGALLVPVAAAANRAVTLTYRWDRHLVPLPGARVAIDFGPIIDTRASQMTAVGLASLQAEISRALTASSRNAHLAAGASLPAPVLPTARA